MKSTEDYLADLVATQAVTNERLGQIAQDIERLDENLASLRRDIRQEINTLLADVKATEAKQNGAIQTNQKKFPGWPNSSKGWRFKSSD